MMRPIRYRPLLGVAAILLLLSGCDLDPAITLLNAHDPLSAQYIPTTPTGLDANTGLDSVVNLGWYDESLGEEGFVVERRLGNPGTFVRIATLPANTTHYADSLTLPDGQLYGYRIGVMLHGTVTSYTNAFPVMFSANPPGLRASFTAPAVVRFNIDLTGSFRTWTMERSVDGGAYQTLVTRTPSTIIWNDSTITAPHTYVYRATAFTGRNTTQYSYPIGVKYSGSSFVFFTP